jgi:hypothetical protein
MGTIKGTKHGKHFCYKHTGYQLQLSQGLEKVAKQVYFHELKKK